jgi:hypothetical protein
MSLLFAKVDMVSVALGTLKKSVTRCSILHDIKSDSKKGFCLLFFIFVFSCCLAASLNLRINLQDLSRAADCGRMPPTVGDLLKTHESMSELDLQADACVQSPSALYGALDAWLCLLAKISVGVEGEHCSNHLLREKALRAARRGRRELGSHIVACLRGH